MAKKKRNPPASSASGIRPGEAASAPDTSGKETPARPQPRPAALAILPPEIVRGDWTVLILALMMFLAPAAGVPNEEMLQDTLKSVIVSFGALGAGLMLFWHQRNRRDGLRWHALMWLPLALMVYALGSMVWSHAYLGGVEAVRWFIFSLLLWLGLNTLARERVPTLAWGIHWGAVVASLWTVLQFWVDFKYFPQGPNPASTFVNRNFFAEFAVCTLPFSVLLITRTRASAQIALLAFTTGFNIVAIMMTGTRSALLAMLAMVLVLPVVLWLYRKQLSFAHWSSGSRILLFGVLLGTIVGLGLIPSGNAKVLEEHRVEQRGANALQRAFARSKSMTQTEEYTERSFSVRLVMWKATARIIQARPLTGVGAGAWEVDIPLYQSEGSQLETDYYVHNEILQLLAEYGLVGWLFLLALLAYLSTAAWKTVRNRSPEAQAEAPLRALTLLSLLMFLIVSNAGFPWRMASTGAIFALALAILAASDARLGYRSVLAATRVPWQPAYSQVLAVSLMVCLALAAYITQQAAACEAKIVKAVKLSMAISQSGDPNNPKWDKTKREMLTLIKEGTDINPHYRKITPMVADEMAKWGDWKNAVWVWESVLSSRPYVVAIMSNVARGYAQLGQNDKALEVLARAKALQPKATSVNSLEVILLSRTGQEPEALKKAKALVEAGTYDVDLINAAYVLAARAKDWPLAFKALELRTKGWPNTAVDGALKAGNIYASVAEVKDETKALAEYRKALMLSTDAEKTATRAQIPSLYQPRL
ncbi:MAG: O-antigen ligase family protein [Burkholderiaceae bacterium]|nr:O-antigen ligase family protein [Burkholderiaceae bacterium]